MTRIRKEHSGEHEDTTYVYSRTEDRSFWARTSAFVEKYKVLFWAGFLLASAAGFGFRTPQQVFGEIHSQIDSLQVQVKQAKTERTTLENKIDALIKLECVRIQREHLETEADLAGIDCYRRNP